MPYPVMSYHAQSAGDNNHVVQSRVYADEAARLADTAFLITDIGRIAHQESDNTFWMLTNHSPVAWYALTNDSPIPDPGGAPVNVNKSTASAGTSPDFSRADHKHNADTAAAVSLTPSSINAEGSSTSLARADHTHAIPTAAAISVSPDNTNTAGSSNSFARSDHGHALPTAAAVSVAPNNTNTAGTANSVSRSDHTHALASAAPLSTITPGDSNSAGTANTVARSDHSHALPPFGSTAGTFCQGNDARLSDSRPPTGAASGQLGGTYPGPDVRGMRETSGPTLLTYGACADGQLLQRVSATVVGFSLFAGTTPAALSPGGSGSAGAGTTAARIDHTHALPAFGTLAGTFCEGNDARLSDSRPPNGSAGGQLGGTYPNPDVRGLRETGGPTLLTVATITDGQALIRSGTTIASAPFPTIGGAPVNVTKAAAAAGVSTNYAREDHKHDITTAAPSTSLTATTTNAEGAATSLARSDHTHAITTAAPIAVAPDNVSGAGTATTLARSDHSHTLATAAAISLTPGNTNTAGTANTVSRSDHTHAIPAFGSTAGTFCQGNDARLSDARTPTGAAGGQLGGTYPNPDVRGLRETSGPALLTMGSVTAGQYLSRNPAADTIIGVTPPVFGTESQIQESLALSTVASAVFTNKTTLTTPSIPAGTYRLDWSFQWYFTDGGNDFEAQIVQDGATTFLITKQEPQDAGIEQRHPAAGSIFSVLTAGVHSFALNYRRDAGGGTAGIINARLHLFRIA